MSRDDHWEDEKPRRPGDRWAEDDSEPSYRPSRARSSGQSGAVTALGVVTLILGALVLLVGMCGGAGIIIAVEDQMHGMAPADQGGPVKALLICLVALSWGGATLASGVGLLGRRTWARILTLVLAAFGALAGLVLLLFGVAIWFAPNIAMDGPERAALIVVSLLVLSLGLLLLGYCLWAFLVLLSSRRGQEFR